MAFQVQKTTPNSTVWVDPANLEQTVRLKQTQGSKSLNGIAMTNHVTEIIINDVNGITVDSVNASEALSCRLRVSGSQHSKTELLALIDLLSKMVVDWAATNYTVGFTPSVVPDPI